MKMDEFIQFCSLGDVKNAYFHYNQYKINIHHNSEYAFRSAVKNNKINIVKWLCTLDNKVDIHANNDEAFYTSCRQGFIEIAQWLYSYDKINLTTFPISYLLSSCIKWNELESYQSKFIQKKVIQVLNWLYTLRDWEYDYYDVFIRVCKNGNLLLAQWLYDKYTISLELNNELLDSIVLSGNMHIIYWIHELQKDKFDDTVLYYISYRACKINHINTVLFAVPLIKDKSILTKNNTLFNCITERNYVHLAKVLNLLLEDIKFLIENNTIISWRKLDYGNIFNDSMYTFMGSNTDECLICIENKEYNINLECNHTYCRDCFLKLNKCPMCFSVINMDKLQLLKNNLI